jgi:hypothetical protein
MKKPQRLIPPPELAPLVPQSASREECIAAWFDLVDATDEILLANLRSRGLSEAEALAEYRRDYARWVEEHDRKVRHMLTDRHRKSQQGG